MNTININTPIKKSIKIMNELEIKVLVVVDKNKIVKGVITDGDLRRIFLKSIDFNENISKIMNTKPFIIKEKKIKTLKITDKERKLYRYAIVSDEKNRYVKLYDLNVKDNNIKETPVLIMAGGKGKRLLPLTKNLPKPLVQIGSTPMIVELINQIYSQGYQKIFISINFMKNLIKKKLSKLKNKKIDLKFLEENKPMGTAGSIFLLKKKKLNSKNFFVVNCDIWSKLNLAGIQNFHEKTKSDLTVVVKHKYINLDFGKVIIKKDAITDIIEKPTENFYFSAGVYVINSNLLKYTKNSFLDMPEFIKKMISFKKKIRAYYIYEEWMDIGTHINLNKIKFKKK